MNNGPSQMNNGPPPCGNNVPAPSFNNNGSPPPFLNNGSPPPFLNNGSPPPFMNNGPPPPFMNNGPPPPFMNNYPPYQGYMQPEMNGYPGPQMMYPPNYNLPGPRPFNTVIPSLSGFGSIVVPDPCQNVNPGGYYSPTYLGGPPPMYGSHDSLNLFNGNSISRPPVLPTHTNSIIPYDTDNNPKNRINSSINDPSLTSAPGQDTKNSASEKLNSKIDDNTTFTVPKPVRINSSNDDANFSMPKPINLVSVLQNSEESKK